MKSSRTHINVLGGRRATIDEGLALKAAGAPPAGSLRALGATASIMDATQATERTPQARSSNSTFTYTFRSKSIAPGSTLHMEAPGLASEGKEVGSNQGRSPFGGLAIPLPTQNSTFHASAT